MAEPTVVALVVTQGLTPYLQRTLQGLKNQTQQPNATLVINIGTEKLEEIADTRVLHTPKATSFNAAIKAAMKTFPKLANAEWLWFLHDDSAPAENCLELLLNATKKGLTTAVVGPKQVAWSNTDRILEVGVSATRSARRLSIESADEIDQGQYDDISDVLAVGTAGMLVNTAVWKETRGFDDFLTPYGEGLEFCRRVRLGGHRVVVVPEAKLAHARASYRGMREANEADVTKSFQPRRLAQLYNGMLLLSSMRFILAVIALPFWTLLRAFWRLIEKRFNLAVAEVNAGLQLLIALPTLIKNRRRTRKYAKVPVSVLENLEVTHREINHRRRVEERKERSRKRSLQLEPIAAKLWGTYRGSSLWVGGLGFLTLTLISLYLTHDYRKGITGIGWFNLPDSYSTLFAQAWSGWNLGGLGNPAPVDTLLPLLSLLTAPLSLLGFSPQQQWLSFWQITPALAWITTYWASRVITHRIGWRFLLAGLWVTSATFLLSWNSGRMATLLAAVFIPVFARAWLQTTGQTLSLPIRGAYPVEIPVGIDSGRHQQAAVASCSLVVLASTAPWILLLLLPFLLLAASFASGRRVTQLLLPVPAILFTLPIWIFTFSNPLQNWQVLFVDTGLPVGHAPANTWEIAFGLPVDHHSLNLAFSHNIPQILQPFFGLTMLLPGGFLFAGACLGLFNLQRLNARARVSFLLGLGAFCGSVLASRIVNAHTSEFIYGWAGIGILLASFAWMVTASGAIPVLVLEEKINTYVWRRRQEIAVKRQARAARKLAKNGENSEKLDLEQSSEITISEDGKIHHRIDYTTFSERNTHRLHVLATCVFVLVLAIPLTLLPPSFANPTQTVQPAPAYLTPATSVSAQESERAARFLSLQVNQAGVSTELWRGDGRQLADSTVVQRWKHAKLVAEKQQNAGFNLAADADPVHGKLATLIAELLTAPGTADANQLLSFGIDGIALQLDDSLDRERAQLALDQVGALERAGESGAGTLWRVRPSQKQPSRVFLQAANEITPLADPTVVPVEIPAPAAGTLLVLSEPADSGWSASLHGETLEATNYQGMQAFKLPAKGGVLRLSWYVDWLPIWWVGALASLLGLGIAAIPVSTRRRLDVE